MTELTQEYLDKSLKNLPSKQDVQSIVDKAVDGLAIIIATTVVDPMNEGFDKVDRRFDKVETRLNNLEQGQEEILLKLDNKANAFELKALEKKVGNK